MRDPNRLYDFYNQLRAYHMKYFPDWRFGQFISNLEKWLHDTKKIDDMFYIEEKAMLRFVEDFVIDIGIANK